MESIKNQVGLSRASRSTLRLSTGYQARHKDGGQALGDEVRQDLSPEYEELLPLMKTYALGKAYSKLELFFFQG